MAPSLQPSLQLSLQPCAPSLQPSLQLSLQPCAPSLHPILHPILQPCAPSLPPHAPSLQPAHPACSPAHAVCHPTHAVCRHDEQLVTDPFDATNSMAHFELLNARATALLPDGTPLRLQLQLQPALTRGCSLHYMRLHPTPTTPSTRAVTARGTYRCRRAAAAARTARILGGAAWHDAYRDGGAAARSGVRSLWLGARGQTPHAAAARAATHRSDGCLAAGSAPLWGLSGASLGRRGELTGPLRRVHTAWVPKTARSSWCLPRPRPSVAGYVSLPRTRSQMHRGMHHGMPQGQMQPYVPRAATVCTTGCNRTTARD